MPMYNKSGIAAEASKYGFQRDVFEKVLRLKKLAPHSRDFSHESGAAGNE